MLSELLYTASGGGGSFPITAPDVVLDTVQTSNTFTVTGLTAKPRYIAIVFTINYSQTGWIVLVDVDNELAYQYGIYQSNSSQDYASYSALFGTSMSSTGFTFDGSSLTSNTSRWRYLIWY